MSLSFEDIAGISDPCTRINNIILLFSNSVSELSGASLDAGDSLDAESQMIYAHSVISAETTVQLVIKLLIECQYYSLISNRCKFLTKSLN